MAGFIGLMACAGVGVLLATISPWKINYTQDKSSKYGAIANQYGTLVSLLQLLPQQVT